MIESHDEAAEREVLGAILLTQGQRFPLIATRLAAQDFYKPAHHAIFEAMVNVDNRRAPIDFVSVWAQLEASGTAETLGSVGGADYLRDLAGAAFALDGSSYHADLIVRSARRRQFQALGRLLVASEESDHEAYLEEAEKRIAELSGAVRDTSTVSIMAAMKEYYREIEDRADAFKKGEQAGLLCGFDDMDEIIGGFRPGQLVLIAGTPGAGKSAFVTNSLENMCGPNRGAGILFSLEMIRSEIAERMVASASGVDGRLLRSGNLQGRDWVLISAAITRLVSLKISVNDAAGLTIAEMRNKARQWAMVAARDIKKRVVVVDYLQLVDSTLNKKNQSREREVAEISRALKSLARELSCTVIALSQFNREASKRDAEPMLSDLRDSGSLEQDADVVIFLHRPRKKQEAGKPEVAWHERPYENEHAANVIVAKQRAGNLGRCTLGWDGARTRFYNLKKGG